MNYLTCPKNIVREMQMLNISTYDAARHLKIQHQRFWQMMIRPVAIKDVTAKKLIEMFGVDSVTEA